MQWKVQLSWLLEQWGEIVKINTPFGLNKLPSKETVMQNDDIQNESCTISSWEDLKKESRTQVVPLKMSNTPGGCETASNNYQL